MRMSSELAEKGETDVKRNIVVYYLIRHGLLDNCSRRYSTSHIHVIVLKSLCIPFIHEGHSLSWG